MHGDLAAAVPETASAIPIPPISSISGGRLDSAAVTFMFVAEQRIAGARELLRFRALRSRMLSRCGVP